MRVHPADPRSQRWKCHCTNKDLGILLFAPRAQTTPLQKLLLAAGWSYMNYKETLSPLSPRAQGAADTPGRAGG